MNPNRFSPEIVRNQIQKENQKLVWRALNRCGYSGSGFISNEQLELYYDIETSEQEDIGYISKGWEDPGYRVGNVIQIPLSRIERKKNLLPALMKYCATRGVAMTGDKLNSDTFELHLDSVIYADGFNKKVMYQVLECLSDCTDKVRTAFVTVESDAVPSTLLPAKFRFTLGGYHGPCHELDWKHRTLWYRWAEHSYLWQPAIELWPSAEAWEHFWQAVEDAGLWQWDDNYEDADVLDGIQWSLKLKSQGKSLSSVGSNAFPGCDQPDYPETCQFGQFVKALRELTGQASMC